MEDAACIVACETLRQELNLVMQNRACTLPVYWIDADRHAWPDKLRESIQEALDSLPGSRVVLLLFGFCGNALVGINAGTHTLVVPRAADCIPLFIGSRKERDSYGNDTYFFTEGHFNSGGGIASDASRVVQRYGEKRGLYILKKMFCHYRNFAVIDTGAFDVSELRTKVERFAAQLEIPVKVIPGSLRLIDALLSCSWPEDDFLIVKPGGSVSFEDSLRVGKARQPDAR
ncbi:MAG: DUF1638 domain-containing protein [Acidobacteria bacterium]|nr:DUF1638 domain-containing protein [Acidobacteriota bacterium]